MTLFFLLLSTNCSLEFLLGSQPWKGCTSFLCSFEAPCHDHNFLLSSVYGWLSFSISTQLIPPRSDLGTYAAVIVYY